MDDEEKDILRNIIEGVDHHLEVMNSVIEELNSSMQSLNICLKKIKEKVL